MRVYVETSAAAKLLSKEAETPALTDYLNAHSPSLVSAALTETELRRAASREGIDQARVTEILARLEVVVPDGPVYAAAGRLPGQFLRSLDAIHIATAQSVGAQVIVSYDRRQIDAARAAGIPVVSPG